MRARMLVLLFLVVAVGCEGAPEPGTFPTDTPAESPSPGGTQAGAETVQIYLHSGDPNDCSEVVAVERQVGGRPTLRTGMEHLLAGPTEAEQAEGLGGWFSEETRALLISAEREGDVARVDFEDLREVIPNASSSCGSAMLLAQLDSTAEQFGASRTLYSINGDLNTFYEWLQMTVPDP